MNVWQSPKTPLVFTETAHGQMINNSITRARLL